MGSRDVLVVRHDDEVGPGSLADVARAMGFQLVTTSPLELREALRASPAGVVSLGGYGSVTLAEEWARAETAALAEAVRRGVPVLGICLGCQLLASALGGDVFTAPQAEVGVLPVQLTADGIADPVLSVLRDRVVSFHEDTWELPPGARLLAVSALGPQAFRMGSALGVQFHPEAGVAEVATWLDRLAPRVLELGIEPVALLDAVASDSRRLRDQGEALLRTWLATVSDLADESGRDR